MFLQWSSLSILVVPVMFYLSISSDWNTKLTAAYNQDSLTRANDSLPIFGEPKLPLDLVPRLEKCLPFKSCATLVTSPRDWQPHLKWLYEFWPSSPSLQKLKFNKIDLGRDNTECSSLQPFCSPHQSRLPFLLQTSDIFKERRGHRACFQHSQSL